MALFLSCARHMAQLAIQKTARHAPAYLSCITQLAVISDFFLSSGLTHASPHTIHRGFMPVDLSFQTGDRISTKWSLGVHKAVTGQ